MLRSRQVAGMTLDLFYRRVKKQIKKMWAWIIPLSMPCISASTNRRVYKLWRTGCLHNTRIGVGRKCISMITRYGASGPIIITCFDNDIDVSKTQNLARCNVGIIFHLMNKLIKFISMNIEMRACSIILLSKKTHLKTHLKINIRIYIKISI